MINQSKPNETIFLESIAYKFNSLFISQPVTLIGQPETIIEIDGGSIFIDFRKNGGDNLVTETKDGHEQVENSPENTRNDYL